MNYQTFCLDLLYKCNEVALNSFNRIQKPTIKPNDANQILTKTDLTLSSLLVSHISKTFPNHNIIDEETGVINNNSSFTWVLDPIDGSSNYAVGNPLFILHFKYR